MPAGALGRFEIFKSPIHGVLDISTGDLGTQVTYTPNAGFVGADRFEFRVADGSTISESAAIDISVLGPDSPVLLSATPNRGIATRGIRSVISGLNLATATSVSMSIGSANIDASIESSDDHELTFVTSPSASAMFGSADIDVTTASGSAKLIRGMRLEQQRDFVVSSVLPAARSIQVGQPATALTTIVNGGNVPAEDCVIRPEAALPAAFAFQTTDPVTYAPTGVLNAPATIQVGQAQNFVIAFTPTAPFELQSVPLVFECNGDVRAPKFEGVNTFLLGAS